MLREGCASRGCSIQLLALRPKTSVSHATSVSASLSKVHADSVKLPMHGRDSWQAARSRRPEKTTQLLVSLQAAAPSTDGDRRTSTRCPTTSRLLSMSTMDADTPKGTPGMSVAGCCVMWTTRLDASILTEPCCTMTSLVGPTHLTSTCNTPPADVAFSEGRLLRDMVAFAAPTASVRISCTPSVLSVRQVTAMGAFETLVPR
mmetsp:Transcript_29772/g.88130  ORF Transcript_29772/g.88130 Transcript_29772/m.88130 type:complete len:203 (-) Transcript_29772:840-1448(-)